MATIPEVPQEQRIVPIEGGRKIAIPTFNGGSVTPQETFATPYVGGESTINIIDNVAQTFNKIADAQTIVDQQARGYKEQQEAVAKGDPTYVAPGATFTTAGQAYQKGAKIAYVSNEVLEMDRKIKEYSSSTGLETEKFLKQTNEYKKNWLGKFDSTLQTEMAIEWDKLVRNEVLNKQTKVVQRDIALQRETMDDYDQFRLDQLKAAVLAGGPNAVGVEDPIKELILSAAKRKESGQSAEDIIKAQENIKLQIAQTVAYKTYMDLNDPNSPSYNPQAAKTYIEDIRVGKVNPMGEFGDTYGGFFNNGGTIGPKERSGIVTLLNHVDSELTKKLVFDRHKIKLSNDSIIENVKEGASFEISPGGMAVYKKIELPVNEMIAAKFSTAEIQEAQLKISQANQVGEFAFLAITSSPSDQEKILATINQLKIESENNTQIDGVQKGIVLGNLNEAEKKVRAIFEEKKKALTNEDQIDFMVKRLKIPFDTSSDQGVDAGMEMMQKIFNLPFSMMPMPKAQGAIEYSTLATQRTGDGVLGVIGSGKAKLPKYYEAMVVRGLKDATPKDLDHAIIGVMDVAASGDRGVIAARELAQDWVNRKQLIEAFETKFGKQANGYKQDAEKAFYQQYGQFVDLNTDHGQGIKATFMLKYYAAAQNYSSGDIATKKQAMEYATKFVDQFYPKIKFANGSSAIVPIRTESGDDKNYSIEQIQKKANDVLTNPSKYGVITGPSETYDDWMQDQKRLRFVYDQGRLVLRTDNNMNVTKIYQRLPSGGNEIMGTDLMISFKKQNGVTTDVEKTTQYDSDPSWYTKFSQSYKPTYERKFTTSQPETSMDNASLEMTSIEAKNAQQWGQEFLRYSNDTIPKIIDKEKKQTNRFAYQDRFVRNIVNERDLETTNVYNAISLALKDGKIDDNMLQYMASTSSYLGTWLSNPYNRNVVIDTWSKNYKNLTKIKTFNDAPTNMSVLQSFTAMMKDLEPQFASEKVKNALMNQYSTVDYNLVSP